MPRVRLADEVTIVPVVTPADVPPASEVWLHGKSTGHQLSGLVLEAAAAVADDYLLFLTDDVPYEEFLAVHLIDRRGRLLDSARIGGMYSTGSFSALTLMEPDAVGFRFIGDTDWTVQVFAESRLQLPFVSDPAGVSRPLGLKRRFRVLGQPRPDR